MLDEIAHNIKTEVDVKIDTMLNKRKIRENLVSVKNQMLFTLKRKIDEWYIEELKNINQVEESIKNFKRE